MKAKLIISLFFFFASLLLLPSSWESRKSKLRFSALPPLKSLALMEDMHRETITLYQEVEKINRHLLFLKAATTLPQKQGKTLEQLLREIEKQEQKLHKAIQVLAQVQKQTRYTRRLVEGTLSHTLALEHETEANLKVSTGLKKEFQEGSSLIDKIEKEMGEAEKIFKEMNEKLPKNLPL